MARRARARRRIDQARRLLKRAYKDLPEPDAALVAWLRLQLEKARDEAMEPGALAARHRARHDREHMAEQWEWQQRSLATRGPEPGPSTTSLLDEVLHP